MDRREQDYRPISKAGKPLCFRKTSHAKFKGDGQGWQFTEINDTLNIFDNGETRTPTLIMVYDWHRQDTRMTELRDVCVTAAAGWGGGGNNMPYVLEGEEGDDTVNMIVRRLTPLECERLQGYPDGWTDIGEWIDSKGKTRKSTDGARYKALGNSIALPWWDWMIGRLCSYYDRPVEMASLFDGIGGFDLCFARHGGIPVWNSEIEEFCEAVSTKHFGDDDKGIKGDFEDFLETSND